MDRGLFAVGRHGCTEGQTDVVKAKKTGWPNTCPRYSMLHYKYTSRLVARSYS